MQGRLDLLRQGYSDAAISAWLRLPKTLKLSHPSVELAQNAGLIPVDLEIYRPFNVVVRLPSRMKREFVMHHSQQSAMDVYKAVADEMGVEYVSLKTKDGRELSEHTYMELWNGRHDLKFYATPSDARSWDKRPQIPPREALGQLQRNVVDAIVRTGDFTMDGAKSAAAVAVREIDDSISEALDMSPQDMFSRLFYAVEMAVNRIRTLFAASASVPVTIVKEQLAKQIASRFEEEPQVLAHVQPRTADAPLHLALQDSTSHIGFRPSFNSYPQCCDIKVHKRLAGETELNKPTTVLEPGDCLVVTWKKFNIQKEKSRLSAGMRNNIARKLVGGSVSGPDINGTTLACLDWRVAGGRNWVNLVAERRSRLLDQRNPYGPCFVIPAQEGEYAIRIYKMYGGTWEFDGERIFKLATHVTMVVGEGVSPFLEMSKVSKYVNQTQDSYLVSPITLQANQHFAPLESQVTSVALWKNSAEFTRVPAQGGPPQLERVYTTKDIDAVEGLREGKETDHNDYVWYSTRLRDSAQAIQALLGTVQLYETKIPDDSRFWKELPEVLRNRLLETHGYLGPAEPLGGRAESSSPVAIYRGAEFSGTPEGKIFRHVRNAASLVDRHLRFVSEPTEDMRTLGKFILYDGECRVRCSPEIVEDRESIIHLIVLQIVLVRGQWSATVHDLDISYLFHLGLLAHDGNKISDSSRYTSVLRDVKRFAKNSQAVYREEFDDFRMSKREGSLPVSFSTVSKIFEEGKLPSSFPIWIHHRALLIHRDGKRAARVYHRFKDREPTILLPIAKSPQSMVVDMQFNFVNPWDNVFLITKIPATAEGETKTTSVQLGTNKVYSMACRNRPSFQIQYQNAWYKIE